MSDIRSPEFLKRFWEKVRLGPGCWWWTASVTGVGYGQIRLGTTNVPAHRVSYELHHGTVPEGLLVLHECDNRDCVNPEHLFLGTHQDNTDDMIKKGRDRHNGPNDPARGEEHGRSKLTAAQVAEIRGRYKAGGISQVALGREYGVSGAHICGIVKGKFWAENVPALRQKAG